MLLLILWQSSLGLKLFQQSQQYKEVISWFDNFLVKEFSSKNLLSGKFVAHAQADFKVW